MSDYVNMYGPVHELNKKFCSMGHGQKCPNARTRRKDSFTLGVFVLCTTEKRTLLFDRAKTVAKTTIHVGDCQKSKVKSQK